MQDFCGELCRDQDFLKGTSEKFHLKQPNDWDSFFGSRAASASKAAFDRLVVGPRQRSDRISRKLKSGESCDIYRAVLLALSYGGPRTTSTYEEIRSWLKEILDDDVPQAHEVTAVLQHMADIARKDIEGEPVIDFDKDLRKVFLADPFFAYFLRWGNDTKSVRTL